MKGQIWRKTFSAGLALLIASGGIPVQPLSQVFDNRAVTANAEDSTLSEQGTAEDPYVISDAADRGTFDGGGHTLMPDPTSGGGNVLTDTSRLDTAVITGIDATYTVTGSVIAVTPVLTALDGTVLTEGIHYTKTLKRNDASADEVKEPGKYAYTFTAIDGSGYSGEQTVNFSVNLPFDVTVGNGTSSDSNVPYRCYTNDVASQNTSQMLYSADRLTELKDCKINSLTFYIDDAQSTSGTVTVRGMKVYLLETDENEMTNVFDVENTENAVLVYNADYTFDSGECVISFTTPYSYSGKNLIVSIANSQIGDDSMAKYFYTDYFWDSCVGVNESDNFYLVQELPKCTFTGYDENYHTVTWKNDDGTLLRQDTKLVRGEEVSYGSTPTKPDTDFLTYAFQYWSPAVVSPLRKDAEYTAVFETIPKNPVTFTVCDGDLNTFSSPYNCYLNSREPNIAQSIYAAELLEGMKDCTVCSLKYYISKNEGDTTVKGLKIYMLETDANSVTGITDVSDGVKVFEGDYTFSGTGECEIKLDKPYIYNGGDLLISMESSETGARHDIYFVSMFLDYRSNYYQYGSYTSWARDVAKCTFVCADEHYYKVTWKNYDGTILKTDDMLVRNEMPQYSGAVPTKPEDDFYTYTFSGWGNITAVTGDATYTAQFTAVPKNFTVTWVDSDGNILKTDSVPYGETPVYSGETPTKAEDDIYTYTFSGWGDVTTVTGNTTYTAQFRATPKHPQSLTVCDSTSYYIGVPYFPSQNDTLTGSDQVYPADMLTELKDRTLWSMTFYLKDDATVDVKGLKIYLAEVDFTTFDDQFAKAENGVVRLYDVASDSITSTFTETNFTAVKVYDHDYDFKQGANLISFDTGYRYSGGNLLVIIENTEPGTRDTNCLFYAEPMDTPCVSRYRYSDHNDTSTTHYLAKCTFGYVADSRHTVTWKDADGNILETDTDVLFGTDPAFDGAFTVPEGMALYWSDGTNTYADDQLPAVTQDVIFKAILAKPLKPGTVFYPGDVVAFDNQYYHADDYHGYIKILNDVGIASITELAYHDFYHQYKIRMKWGAEQKLLWITFPYADSDVGIKVTGGSGTHDDPFTFTIYRDTKHTVTWKDADGNILETDTAVPFGEVPDFNGSVTVPGGEKLYWSDGTELFGDDVLPPVTGDVTYTLAIRTIKQLAVGTVFSFDDVVDFGENNYFNEWDECGEVSANCGIGTAVFRAPIYDSDSNLYEIEDRYSYEYFGVTSDRLDEPFSIKCIAGEGTEEKPFLFKIIPASGENSFKVVCENNGEFVRDIYAASGETISEPTAPDDAPDDDYDYVFIGWLDENGELFDFTKPITRDMILTAKWEKAQATFRQVTATFDGNIRLNFYVSIPDALKTDAFAIFTVNGQITRLNMEDAVSTEHGYRLSINMLAVQIDDNVNLRIYDAENQPIVFTSESGETVFTETGADYTVRAYVDYMSEYGTTEQMRNLAKAARDYCNAAKNNFLHTNLEISQAVKKVTADDLSRYAARQSETTVTGVSVDSITALFESDNSLRLYLDFAGNDTAGYSFTVDGVSAKLKQREKDGKYYLTVENIAAADLDAEHTFTVTRGNESYSSYFSALSYARLGILNGSTDAAKQLSQALYLYNQAANAYFDKTEWRT